MSGINQIASKLLGGGRKASAGRPGTSPGTTGRAGGGTDAAVGRGVRGLLGKLRK